MSTKVTHDAVDAIVGGAVRQHPHQIPAAVARSATSRSTPCSRSSTSRDVVVDVVVDAAVLVMSDSGRPTSAGSRLKTSRARGVDSLTRSARSRKIVPMSVELMRFWKSLLVSAELLDLDLQLLVDGRQLLVDRLQLLLAGLELLGRRAQLLVHRLELLVRRLRLLDLALVLLDRSRAAAP